MPRCGASGEVYYEVRFKINAFLDLTLTTLPGVGQAV